MHLPFLLVALVLVIVSGRHPHLAAPLDPPFPVPKEVLALLGGFDLVAMNVVTGQTRLIKQYNQWEDDPTPIGPLYVDWTKKTLLLGVIWGEKLHKYMFQTDLNGTVLGNWSFHGDSIECLAWNPSGKLYYCGLDHAHQSLCIKQNHLKPGSYWNVMKDFNSFGSNPIGVSIFWQKNNTLIVLGSDDSPCDNICCFVLLFYDVKTWVKYRKLPWRWCDRNEQPDFGDFTINEENGTIYASVHDYVVGVDPVTGKSWLIAGGLPLVAQNLVFIPETSVLLMLVSPQDVQQLLGIHVPTGRHAFLGRVPPGRFCWTFSVPPAGIRNGKD